MTGWANYIVFIVATGGFYALLALSLNLIWGGAGMVNLGLAGFFALGAYASALLTVKVGTPIWIGIASALIVGAIGGYVVTMSTTRLRGDYLAIVTLGFAETIRLIANNEIWLTRGSDGISGIPGPLRADLGGWFNAAYAAGMIGVVALVWFVLRRLDRSPYGRALRALREDEQVAQVAGKKVLRFKIEAFAISAAIAGLAGALYGHFNSYVAPDIFQPLITIYIFLAVAAGGVGRVSGAVLGAYIVIFFLESTRFAAAAIPGLSPVQHAAMREMLIGLALIVVLRWRPQGILPETIPPAPRPASTA
jgi:branched-chain amino acid transport system permease protein